MTVIAPMADRGGSRYSALLLRLFCRCSDQAGGMRDMAGQWRKLTTEAKIGIIGVLVAIVFGVPAYIALIQDGDATEAPPSSAPRTSSEVVTTTTLPFPTPEEQRVLDNISHQIRPSCLRDEEPFEGSLSGVWCTPPSGADTVYFGTFENTGKLSAAYYGTVDTAKVRHGAGDCATRAVAEAAYGTPGDPNTGRVACYIDDGMAWIVWTNEDLRLLGWAFRNDDDSRALYQWWVSSGRRTT